MKQGTWKRLAAMLLAMVLAVGSLPTLTLAGETTNLCEHHPAHTPECGYVEAVEGQACTHVCTDACTKEEVTSCVHEHSEEAGCAYVETVEAKTCDHVCGDGKCGYQPAKEAVPCNCEPTVQHAGDCASLTGGACTCTPETVHQEGCAYQAAVSEVPCDFAHESCGCQAAVPAHWECDHTCSAEFGCVKEVCTHVHSKECGYVEAVEGHLCEYHCEICEKAKACVCDEACTEDAPNSECPVCSANWEDCKHPRCTCARLCAEGAVDTGCPVCTDDYEKCTVQCTCTSACTEESVNSACPVCSVQWDYCNPVSLLGEDGYYIAPNTPDAELEAIKAYLRNPDAEANTVHFAAGTYENLELEIAGTKTLCMDGPVTFSGSAGKIAIQISQPNGANLTLRADSGAENASLTVTGYNHAIRIAGYNDGSHQWLPVSIKIPNLDVTLTECVNTDGTGSAIRISNQCNVNLHVGSETYSSKTGGARVTDEMDQERTKVASLILENNASSGIDVYSGGRGTTEGTWLEVTAIDADMIIQDNGFSGFYLEYYGYAQFTVQGGRFVSDRNNGSGIAFNANYLDRDNGTSDPQFASVPKDRLVKMNKFTAVDSYVSFSNNKTAQGINSGIQRYENCTVMADRNMTGNISADEIDAYNCYISACENQHGSVGQGIYINDIATNMACYYPEIDPDQTAGLDPKTVNIDSERLSVSEFQDCDIVATGNLHNLWINDLQINDGNTSTLISPMRVVFNNTRADFSNAKQLGIYCGVTNGITIGNNSQVIVDNAGNCAFAAYNGKTGITNSFVKLAARNPGSMMVWSWDDRNNSDFIVGENAVVTLMGEAYDTLGVIPGVAFDGKPRSYFFVVGGSLQGRRTYMTNGFKVVDGRLKPTGLGFSLNGHIDTTTASMDVYFAPLNAYGTMLNRFDLHASANKEVGATAQEVAAGASKSFTAYDVSGKAYNYQFRYTKAGEDAANAEASGTAYVWAPVSIIHYDATQGEVVASDENGNKAKDSTAMMGNVALKNTRGDNAVLLNSANGLPTGSRYATDYTIYGNSLQLSEGIQPKAEREGMKFAGWYVRLDDEGKLATDWLEECTYQNGDVDWAKFYEGLNTEVTEKTKLIDLTGTEEKAAEEVTLYAKWFNTYQVAHYLEQRKQPGITTFALAATEEADGKTYVITDTENGEGLAGEQAEYANRQYAGYTYMPQKTRFMAGDNVLSSNIIQGDNSLIIKLYYDITQYTVTYRYIDKGDGIPSNAPALPTAQNYYPGDDVVVAAPKNGTTVKLNGYVYTFHGWSSQDITGKEAAYRAGRSFEMPEKDVILSGYWTKEAQKNDNPKPSHDKHFNAFLPKTGDQIFLWVIILAAASAGLVGLCVYEVKKRRKK
ncbi:MAG: LPXTG cell wall anchor domain-containing protein [Faecousia sp.]